MVRSVLFIGLWAFLWTSADSLQYTKIVHTTYGPVRGEEVKADGVQFKAFRGIPYARPPVGDLRFRAPQPPAKWSRVRDASKFGPVCPQPNLLSNLRVNLNVPHLLRLFLSNAQNMIEGFTRTLSGSEDCLSLNVYTTQIGDSNLKPVLFYIHGGAFVLGDGTDFIYGPEFLMKRGDVVVVTFNYRIGTLGFMSTNTSDASGNWGLKDQVAAMRWVRDNIANFGGDPKQVTIYGQSAGGASVHLHMFSPLSRGLFKRAITASGAATCPWTVTTEQEKVSRKYAEILGASASDAADPAKRVKFFRSIRAKPLAERMTDLLIDQAPETGIPTFIPFAPVIEPPGTEGAFLTESPEKLLVEGRFARVPLMMGVNDLEGGVLFLGFSKYKKPSDLRKVNIDVCKILPGRLRTAVEERKACPEVSKQILDVYFGGKPTNSSPLNFVYLFGDIFLTHGVHESEKWHARYAKKDSPAYFYYYTYDGEWNMLKEIIGLRLPGAIHGEDMDYIFSPKGLKNPALPPSSPGRYNQERMISFATNFAKYGNPTPSLTEAVRIPWEPATESQLKTMHIGRDLKMENNGILNDRLRLWDSIYAKYIGTEIYR